jgi:hypothetical protein
VIPVHIRARNSAPFDLFDAIHPSLRDITLFLETLNKARQPFRVTLGEAISPGARHARQRTRSTCCATLALGGRHAPTVSLVDSTRRPAKA